MKRKEKEEGQDLKLDGGVGALRAEGQRLDHRQVVVQPRRRPLHLQDHTGYGPLHLQEHILQTSSRAGAQIMDPFTCTRRGYGPLHMQEHRF